MILEFRYVHFLSNLKLSVPSLLPSFIDAVYWVTSLEVLGGLCYNVWLEVTGAASRVTDAPPTQTHTHASQYHRSTESYQHSSLTVEGREMYNCAGGSDTESKSSQDCQYDMLFSSYDVENSVGALEDNSVSQDTWFGNIPAPEAFSQDNENQDISNVNSFAQNDNFLSQDANSLSQDVNSLSQEADYLSQDINCLSSGTNSLPQDANSYSRNVYSFSEDPNLLACDLNSYLHDTSQEANSYSHDSNPYLKDANSYSQDANPYSPDANSYSPDVNPHSQNASSYSLDADPYSQNTNSYSQDNNPYLQDNNPYLQEKNHYLRDNNPYLQDVNSYSSDVDPSLQDSNPCSQGALMFSRDVNAISQNNSSQYVHDDSSALSCDEQRVDISPYRFSSHTEDISSSVTDTTITTIQAEDDSDVTSSANTKNSSEEDIYEEEEEEEEEALSTETSTVSTESSGDDYTIQEVCRPYQGHACPLGRRQGPQLGEVCAAVAGMYSRHYGLLHEIGRGAFGSVRLCYRKKDGLLAVAKLIPKSCVGRGNWATVSGRRVPLEVAILTSLDHPNIVSVLDVFDNHDYVQLVMEKFGAGLDLFEFIERDPVLDDALAAYIFAQLVSALVYLRSVGVLHRDVKDENVIINERFSIKLIDFGSATYARREGHLFSQFAGTVEYCSPEVLLGNKYLGPELEVWSVGVTLYTLMVGENPFHNVEQTIHHNPRIPGHLSKGATDLIINMLHKDPKARYTLDQVAQHQWTRQPCDPSQYNFAEVVPSSEEECHPIEYVNSLDVEELYLDDEDCILTTTSDSFTYRPHTEASHRHALSVGCLPLSLYGSPVGPCGLLYRERAQEERLLKGQQQELDACHSRSPSTLSSDSDISSQSSLDDITSAIMQGSGAGQANCAIDSHYLCFLWVNFQTHHSCHLCKPLSYSGLSLGVRAYQCYVVGISKIRESHPTPHHPSPLHPLPSSTLLITHFYQFSLIGLDIVHLGSKGRACAIVKLRFDGNYVERHDTVFKIEARTTINRTCTAM
ncbi:Protein kinase domain [Trinorchestia longiramus]|nr:Protein kinase domain [Trinorchestia longiramus]